MRGHERLLDGGFIQPAAVRAREIEHAQVCERRTVEAIADAVHRRERAVRRPPAHMDGADEVGIALAHAWFWQPATV